MAYSNDKNPFRTDDYDDDSFGRSSGVKSRYTTSGRNPFEDVGDDEFLRGGRGASDPYDHIQDQKQLSMNNQIDSTQRALASIYDSEAIGIATAEELVHQGEQLDNVERKTDKINADMKTTQRHLNSIKSVFGGIKNWWNNKEEKKKEPEEEPSRRKDTKLQLALDSATDSAQSRGDQEHPGLRLKTDTSGFYEDNTDFGASGGASGYQQRSEFKSGMKAYDEQMDRNLEDMTAGMARLKGLALGMGDEISAQNEQIDRINTKVDRADIKIRDQNRQMGRILGK